MACHRGQGSCIPTPHPSCVSASPGPATAQCGSQAHSEQNVMSVKHVCGPFYLLVMYSSLLLQEILSSHRLLQDARAPTGAACHQVGLRIPEAPPPLSCPQKLFFPKYPAPASLSLGKTSRSIKLLRCKWLMECSHRVYQYGHAIRLRHTSPLASHWPDKGDTWGERMTFPRKKKWLSQGHGANKDRA